MAYSAPAISAISPPLKYHRDIGLQKAKETGNMQLIINLGNMFAKKINLGDNFSSFDEFLNKYRDFVYVMEDLGIKLMPTEKVTFFERIFVC